MKQIITFVDINNLIQHESISCARLVEVKKQLQNSGVIRRPVIVDKKTNVNEIKTVMTMFISILTSKIFRLKIGENIPNVIIAVDKLINKSAKDFF